MKERALIFDLDGTLWDSAEPVAIAWSTAGRRYLGPSFNLTSEDVYREMGKTMDQIVADLIPDQDDEKLMKQIAKDLFKLSAERISFRRRNNTVKSICINYTGSNTLDHLKVNVVNVITVNDLTPLLICNCSLYIVNVVIFKNVLT